MWAGRVDQEGNFMPTGSEYLLEGNTSSKPVDLEKASGDLNMAFKAFENAKIDVMQAQVAKVQGEEE